MCLRLRPAGKGSEVTEYLADDKLVLGESIVREAPEGDVAESVNARLCMPSIRCATIGMLPLGVPLESKSNSLF
jgi:hypothetical protein